MQLGWHPVAVVQYILTHKRYAVQYNEPFDAGIIIFLILAHPVYKMWIIQEPNMLELWNKLHFEEEKIGEYIACLKHSVPVFVE